MPRPAPRPEKYIIRLDNGEETTKEFPIPGNGYHWEADAVARCLRDGLKECDRMTVSESIMSMEVSVNEYYTLRQVRYNNTKLSLQFSSWMSSEDREVTNFPHLLHNNKCETRCVM